MFIQWHILRLGRLCSDPLLRNASDHVYSIIMLMIYGISHIRTAEMKWKWRNDRRSEEARKKKFRTSTGFEPVTSRLPVRCSTNWAVKPLTWGAGQLWVHMFPWKKWVLLIDEINHIWTVEMKWKRRKILNQRHLRYARRFKSTNQRIVTKQTSLSGAGLWFWAVNGRDTHDTWLS